MGKVRWNRGAIHFVFAHDTRGILGHFCFELDIPDAVGRIKSFDEKEIHFKAYNRKTGEIVAEDISVPYTKFFKQRTHYPWPVKEIYPELPEGSPLERNLAEYLWA